MAGKWWYSAQPLEASHVTEMLIAHIEALAAFAPTWGFLLVVLFMTIESSFIPFPSEVVMIPAGFLAARGGLTLGNPGLDAAVAIFAGTFGSLLGAYINYFLFRTLGSPFLEKYGKYFLLPPPKLHRAEELFRRYGAGATFVCRLLPAIRQLISIPAGIARMPLKSFTLWTGLGAGLWVTLLTLIGFAIGKNTASMSYAELVHTGTEMVRHHFVWMVPALLGAFAVYVLVSKKIMESRQPAQQGSGTA
jgi:membrane protein DedA with SNARE-associated domain